MVTFAGMQTRASSVKVKFTLIAVSVSLLCFGIFVFLSYRFTVKDNEGHHREKAWLIWTHVIHDFEQAMISRTHEIIPELRNIYQKHDVKELRFFNLKGQEVFAKEKGPSEDRVEEAFRKGEVIDYENKKGKGHAAFYIIPIRNRPECHGCHGTDNKFRGALLLTLSLKEMDEDIAAESRRYALLFGFTVIVISLATILSTSRLFLKPLAQIQKGTEAIGKGEFNYRIAVDSKDEIGVLAGHFNRMARLIHDKNEALWDQFTLVSRSQKEWQETFDTIKDLVAIIDRDMNITSANRTFAEYFSLPLFETIERKCGELFAPHFQSEWIHKMDFPDKTPLIFDQPDTRTGKILQISIFPRFSSQEEFQGVVLVAKDITEHKQKDDALQESERKFRRLSQEFNTLLDAIPDNLILLSPDLKVLWTNRAVSASIGREISDLIGQRYCIRLRDTPSSPCNDCLAMKSFQTGKTAGDQISTPDGRFWDVRTFPIKDEKGGVISVIEVATDITEKLMLQAEAIRAGHLASLGELAAGVAHEINNPINGIINYAQILANLSSTETRENDLANRIIKEGDRIAGIVGNLLSFSRDRGEGKRTVVVSEVLSESLALTEVQIRKDNIDLKMEVPPDLPRIIAHPQQIQQVFLNVLNNARYALNEKYPGRHEGKILKITGRRITLEGLPYVQIEFYDQGTGIPASLLHKVKNPFVTTKPTGKGTGLGLSISHGIISDHGGKLTIESGEGEYTRVIIDLPAK